jgi:DNA mismatch repair protein MutS2
MGVAGRSAGLDIAERHGIPPEVVSRARNLLDPHVREGEDYLRRLRDTLAEAEAGVAKLRRERRGFEEEQQGWRTRREEEDTARGREADHRLGRALDDFRRAARRELAALTEPVARARAERRRTLAERRLTAERSRQRSEIVGDSARSVPPGAPVSGEGLAPGARVWVRSVGRVGLVEELRGRVAEVRLGRVLFRVDVDELHEPPEGTQAEPGRPDGPRAEVRAPIGAACPRELLLVGRRVDAALDELDRFLDAAQLADHDEVRIIHGHGTGRLRSAVRGHLESHDQVRSHRPGRGGEGGDGVTVVRLD